MGRSNLSDFYLGDVPQPPSSLRKLYSKLAAVAGKPVWIALYPTSSVHVKAWQDDRLIAIIDPVEASKVATAAPLGGAVSSRQAPWAEAYVAALLGANDEYAVHCYGRDGSPVALVGWHMDGLSRLRDLRRRMPAVSEVLRSIHDLSVLQAEAAALRHVLAQADSCVAAGRLGGEVVGASMPAGELLAHLAYGSRHYFRRESAPLPVPLVDAVAKAAAGQQKLSSACTARFAMLNAPGAEWCPLVAVEFFVEKQASTGIRLSLLTPVERETLDLLALGATNPEIARQRGVAANTVKNQVAEILRKTGLARRTELIAAHHYGPFGVETTPRSAPASTR